MPIAASCVHAPRVGRDRLAINLKSTMTLPLDRLRRTTDITVALAVLLVTAPVMALASACVFMRGCVIWPVRQHGVGGGVVTRLVSPGTGIWWTRLGFDRWLTWWHVLRGELALVGPRFVPTSEMSDRHKSAPKWIWLLPGSRPGITGPAQRCRDEGVAPFASLRDRVLFDLAQLPRYDDVPPGRLDGLASDGAELARRVARVVSPCRAVGNDYVRFEVPRPWRWSSMTACAWLADAPPEMGSEIDEPAGARVSGWWYPPRSLALWPSPAVGAQWALLRDVADDLETIGERGVRIHREWPNASADEGNDPDDILRIDIPAGLHAIDRLCARLDVLWAPFGEAVPLHLALLAACGYVASTNPDPDDDRLLIELRWNAFEASITVVPGSTSRLTQSTRRSGEHDRATSWSRAWDTTVIEALR